MTRKQEAPLVAQALDDVRVLELQGPRAQYCGKLLADLGADVIKVEPPGGDPARRIGPFHDGVAHRERSLQFFYFNTNKRSVALDLECEAGRDAFRELARTADVILESFEPGTLDALGLGFEELRSDNPGLVLTSITGFGQSGPHAHYRAPDLVSIAMSGVMFLSGYPDDPPNLPHGGQSEYCAGIWGAIGTLTALHERFGSGEGQRVDVSAQEALLLNQETAMQTWDLRGELRGRFGEERMIPSFPGLEFPGFGTYECADGHVMCMMAVLSGGGWSSVVEWMDESGLAEELTSDAWRPFIAGLGLRELVDEMRDADEAAWVGVKRKLARLDEVLRRFILTRSKLDLYVEGQRRNLVLAPVSSPKDLIESPQLAARGYFHEVEHPELGQTIRYPGAPYRHSKTPWSIRRRPPLFAEHSEEVFCGELGMRREALPALTPPGGG
jgi:benzylsuccinate CoA-transferase BbsE subunit